MHDILHMFVNNTPVCKCDSSVYLTCKSEHLLVIHIGDVLSDILIDSLEHKLKIEALLSQFGDILTCLSLYLLGSRCYF